jgi:aminotransferase in exopolysaccharide biosynthesis
MFDKTFEFIRGIYGENGSIALHEPKFMGNEMQYLKDCIDSTYVSSVGKYVDEFEKKICELTGAKYAVATVNGTSALHIALLVSGVKENELVITQPLSFVASANAISYIKAEPVFVDVDLDTLGLSPDKLKEFLENETELKGDGITYHNLSGKKISACVPMHSYGFPCRVDEIVTICHQYNIRVVEDAAESVGSYFKGQHTGTFGLVGVFSLNGNKIITSGGGGAIITDDELLAQRAKHITTVAKVPHPWKFEHDEIAYNYRMPNINAALACAQLDQLSNFLKLKRSLANKYRDFFKPFENVSYLEEPPDCTANYWLNTIMFDDPKEKEQFLEHSNENGVMTRPVWELLSNLKIYRDCIKSNLDNAEWISARLVCLPSSVPIN